MTMLPAPRIREYLRNHFEQYDLSRKRAIIACSELVLEHIVALEEDGWVPHTQHHVELPSDIELPASIHDACKKLRNAELKVLSRQLSYATNFTVTVIRLFGGSVVMRFGRVLV